MLSTRTIVIALVLVASTLSACGKRSSDSAITQLDINQPTPSRPAAPPEEGALVLLDDAVPVGINDACHATYYTKRSPEEAIIAVNGLFKAKGFRVNPAISRRQWELQLLTAKVNPPHERGEGFDIKSVVSMNIITRNTLQKLRLHSNAELLRTRDTSLIGTLRG